MKNILLIVLINLFTYQSIATDKYDRVINSLESQLNEINNKWLLGDKSSAYAKMNLLNKKSLTTQDTVLIINTYNSLGTYNLDLEKYDDALYYFDRAIRISTKSSLSVLAKRAYINTSITYRRKGNYKKARQYIKRCLSGLNKINNTENIKASAYNELALLNMQIHKHHLAIININKSLVLYESISDTYNTINTLTNKGIIYMENGDFDSAKINIQKALEINKSNDSQKYYSYTIMGKVYFKENKFEISKIYFKKCISFYKQTENTNAQINCLFYLSKIEIHSREYNKALKLLGTANTIAKGKNSVELQIEIEKLFRDIYRLQKNHKKLKVCNTKLSDLRREFNTIENKKLLNKIKTKFYISQSKKENQLEQSKLEIKNSQIKIYLILLIASSVLSLLTAYIYRLYKTEAKRKIELSDHISSSHKEENIISAKLRNIISTKINNLDLEHASINSKHKENIIRISNTIKKLSFDLDLNHIAKQDLNDAISESLRKYNINGIIDINIEILDDFSDMSYHKKLQYLHIIGELINYTIHYSKAKEVFIFFAKEGNGLYFCYKHTDLGLDIYSEGIKNIKSRVEDIGAKLSIKTEELKGMIVEINEKNYSNT